MKKKISLGLVVLMLLAVMAVPAFAKGLTIGVVIPYEGGWFTAFHAGYQLVCDKNGDKIVWAYHNYKAEDEGKAVENLIARGVDAINVTAVSPESAEYSCRLANEAGDSHPDHRERHCDRARASRSPTSTSTGSTCTRRLPTACART